MYCLYYHFSALAVVNNTIVCKPVNCLSVYGTLRPIFNPSTGLCVAQQTIPPTPSQGALPINNSETTGILTCVHGTIVCLSTCTCKCTDGWTTAVDGTTVFSKILCNSSSASSGGAGGIVGQASSSGSCKNAVECFFVDQLPYVLVSTLPLPPLNPSQGERSFIA